MSLGPGQSGRYPTHFVQRYPHQPNRCSRPLADTVASPPPYACAELLLRAPTKHWSRHHGRSQCPIRRCSCQLLHPSACNVRCRPPRCHCLNRTPGVRPCARRVRMYAREYERGRQAPTLRCSAAAAAYNFLAIATGHGVHSQSHLATCILSSQLAAMAHCDNRPSQFHPQNCENFRSFSWGERLPFSEVRTQAYPAPNSGRRSNALR